MLLLNFLKLCDGWGNVFSQQRTIKRAIRHSLMGLCSLGRGTITRAIMTAGRNFVDWSGDYYLYSRCQWEIKDLFQNIINKTVNNSYKNYVAVAWDETKIKKTGRKIPGVSYQRDPMSPPFHTNFILGHRYLQASALLPLHQKHNVSCRGIPVAFSAIPRIEKPKKKALKEEWIAYEIERKKHNLSTHFVEKLNEMRLMYDKTDGKNKILVATCDGAFCNKTVFNSNIERTIILTRCRKDLSLCFSATDSPRQVYNKEKFTPESKRKDNSIKWKTKKIFHGKKWREVKYKEIKNVLWQRGAKRKLLRLIVLKPIPYRISQNGRLYYRQPSYLLCDNIEAPVETLIQIYFDRWQIEVNFRDEKETLGIGQAQVWSDKSVEKQPAFMVAAYSMLLLASLKAYGAKRTKNYVQHPRWRKKEERPSCLDLITQLRMEVVGDSDTTYRVGIETSANKFINSAAA